MNPQLTIEFDYSKHRRKPNEVFEAMALYIIAYQSLAQLLNKSMGNKELFELQLTDIEIGSIIGKLCALPGKLHSEIETALYKAGNNLFKELAVIDSTKGEDEVEKLAASLEQHLKEAAPETIADPCIDRQELAFVLNEISHANQKTHDREAVLVSENSENKATPINTKWRFHGNPGEMFLGHTEHYETEDFMEIRVNVNQGVAAWTFRSQSSGRSFDARIADTAWLKRYQAGHEPAIGPKDLMHAKVTYDIYTPPKGKGQPQVRNAKVISVIDIIHQTGQQHELITQF